MSKFAKGHAKVGGKRKGSKHKITRDLVGLLDALGCNPIEGLARIAEDPKAKLELRAYCNTQIAKYVHPQLKAIELSGPGGGPIQHDISDRNELISRLHQIEAGEDPSSLG